jgi:adenylate cyclase
MAIPGLSRRLAAILAADIAGYSALMGANEARTAQDLKAHQGCSSNGWAVGGRIIDTAGDGILAELKSVANAVECAVAIQDTMRTKNAETKGHRKMQYRIGINLGDVIYDESRILARVSMQLLACKVSRNPKGSASRARCMKIFAARSNQLR